MEEIDRLKAHITLNEKLRDIRRKLKEGSQDEQIEALNDLGNMSQDESLDLLLEVYFSSPIALLNNNIKQILLSHRGRIIPMLIDILSHQEFIEGNLSTQFLKDYFSYWKAESQYSKISLIAASICQHFQEGITSDDKKKNQISIWKSIGDWHN